MAGVLVQVSRIQLCSLILSWIGLQVLPMLTLPHSQGNQAAFTGKTKLSCSVGFTASFGCTRCDLSVVSDLKTAHTSCC